MDGIVQKAFEQAFPGEDFSFVRVLPATDAKFGDYQCNDALKLAKRLKMPPRAIAEKVAALLPLKAAIKYTMFFGRFGMWLVIGLIVTGLFKYILYPPMYAVMSVISKFLAL